MKKDVSIKIYRFLQTIPYGKVVSYKTIAQIFNIHARTVGVIMRRNIQPEVYPCYKVLTSNGSLGGYNRGIAEKIKKLQQDGIAICNGKVGKTYFRKTGRSAF